MKINSIETLCDFIIKYNPSTKKLNEIIWKMGLRIIILEDEKPDKLCILINDYWNKWGNKFERPIFLYDYLD
jgi:hypothetical protein